jgi:hypothetical protein
VFIHTNSDFLKRKKEAKKEKGSLNMENSSSFPHLKSKTNNNNSVYFFQDMTKTG